MRKLAYRNWQQNYWVTINSGLYTIQKKNMITTDVIIQKTKRTSAPTLNEETEGKYMDIYLRTVCA